MNLKEDIGFLLESNEKSRERILYKLNINYADVKGLDNLLNLITCMDENNYFVDFNNLIEHMQNLNEFKYKKDPIYSSKSDFIKMACSQLDTPKFQFIRTPKYLVNLPALEATLMMFEFNFCFYSNGNVKSIQDVVELVFDGNIICPFTFFVDEFKKEYPIPNYSQEFFSKMSKLTFDSDKSRELYDNLIRNYLTIILGNNDVSLRFNSHIRMCARYLMGCNALKHNRDSISCEDVVVGYTVALKLLTEDIREYVIKYYEDDTDLKISDFEVSENSESVQSNGLGFKGAVSIIFAILAFIETILIIIFIKSLLVPSMEFTNNPIIRFGTLILSFIVARLFYNYLTKGNDPNLFEDGKSRVMLVFIIIFIATIVSMCLI